MSVTHYCDGCGHALKEDTDLAHALEFRKEAGYGDTWPKHKISVRTLRAVDDVWNGGDVCRECLLRVVADGFSRVQPPATRGAERSS